MSNYSFNVITIVFSTRTRPRWEFSTLFPTHGLPSIRHNTYTHTNMNTHSPVPTHDPERRKKCFSLPWGTAHNNHWSRTELFSAFSELFPPSGGCCFSASVLWNGSPPPDWLMDSIVWCTVCSFIFINEFVPMFCRESVFVVFFFCLFFFVCEGECLSSICFDSFSPVWDDKTAFLWSYKQLRCIDVPSMRMPLCMWWLLKRSSALSIQEPVTNKCELCQPKRKKGETVITMQTNYIFYCVYCTWAPGRGECTY